MLHQRLKKLLDDIIDVAYADLPQEKRERLKWYKLYVLPKEKKTAGGTYYYRENKLEVYNPRLGSDFMAKALIHELSHRMSYCLNGDAGRGHGKEFYAEYRRLIYAALDMGVLSADTFNKEEWARDQNKVRQIVSEYVPNPVDYVMDFPPVVKVYNSYSIKDDLKARGYAWNNIENLWEKETESPEEETAFLESKGAVERLLDAPETKQLSYSIDENSLLMDPVVYVEAKGNTYDARNKLKELGFTFSKRGKKWVRTIPAKNYPELIEKIAVASIPDVEFKAVNRKTKKSTTVKKGVEKS